MANFCCCRFVCKYGSVSLRRNRTKKKKKTWTKPHTRTHIHITCVLPHSVVLFNFFCFYFVSICCFIFSHILLFWSRDGQFDVQFEWFSLLFRSLSLPFLHTHKNTHILHTNNEPTAHRQTTEYYAVERSQSHHSHNIYSNIRITYSIVSYSRDASISP